MKKETLKTITNLTDSNKSMNEDDIDTFLRKKIKYGIEQFINPITSKDTTAIDFKNWKENIVYELKNKFLDNTEAQRIIRIHNLVLLLVFPPKPKNQAKRIVSELEDITKLLDKTKRR
jgi:hypothetical protein